MNQNTPLTKDAIDTVHHLDINQIEPDPNQPRTHFDEDKLMELADSIKKYDVIQPIIVRREDDKIYLVAGERRLKAAKMAKQKNIKAIFLDSKDFLEISLIENIQREDLTAIEEAEALEQLRDKKNYKAKDLSKIIGKAESTISETLSLNKLPQKIRDECRSDPTWSRRILLEIAKQDTEKKMMQLFKKAKKKDLKSIELRSIARKGKKHAPKTEVVIKRIEAFQDYFSKIKTIDYQEAEGKSVKKKLSELKKAIEDLLQSI